MKRVISVGEYCFVLLNPMIGNHACCYCDMSVDEVFAISWINLKPGSPAQGMRRKPKSVDKMLSEQCGKWLWFLQDKGRVEKTPML